MAAAAAALRVSPSLSTTNTPPASSPALRMNATETQTLRRLSVSFRWCGCQTRGQMTRKALCVFSGDACEYAEPRLATETSGKVAAVCFRHRLPGSDGRDAHVFQSPTAPFMKKQKRRRRQKKRRNFSDGAECVYSAPFSRLRLAAF